MSGTPSLPSTLTIVELTGQQRTLTLTGSGLPKRGAAWEGEQKMVTKFYPGNAGQGTQHVLGPAELPSEWEGVWRTTQLLRTPAAFAGQQLTAASDLAEALDSIRFFGALLQVTWAQDSGRRKVRIGRLRRFKATYDRMDDVAWSATFEWSGRGDTSPQGAVAFKKDDATGGLGQAAIACNAVGAAINSAPFLSSNPTVPLSATVNTLGLSFTLAPGPTSLLASLGVTVSGLSVRLGQVSDLMQAAGSVPPGVVAQASDATMTATASLVSFSDQLGQVPAELMTTYDDRVSSLVTAYTYFGGVLDQVDQASAATATSEQQLRRRRTALDPGARRKDRLQPAELLAVAPAKAGDTFLTLSMRYYGTPDRAADLARANGFPGYQVAPPKGRILVYPKSFGVAAPDTV